MFRSFRVAGAALCLFLTVVSARSAAGGSLPKAGGAITIVQENGVWWFRDTDGTRFFSLGACCIPECFGNTEDKPLARERESETASRMAQWGFNSAGAWSSPTMWSRVNFVTQLYTLFRFETSDVFDETFWEPGFREHVARELSVFPDRRRIIGYCLDNELHWNGHGLYRTYLAWSATSPGSRELVAFTRSVYGNDLAKLNREWKTSLDSFDRLPSVTPPEDGFPSSRKLYSGWAAHVAGTYYRRYAALVRAADPGRLILGVRWAGWADREVLAATAKYFDVNTVNVYNRYGDLADFLQTVYDVTGKPVLLTEFGFSGYPDPGSPSGLFVDVYTQARRAAGYRKTVMAAARAPFMVGTHWFMWQDYQPKHSPNDWLAPDHNVGIVSADGKTPWRELVEACARTNAEVAAVHRGGGGWIKPVPPVPVRRDIPFFKPVVDGWLDEWPDACMFKPEIRRSLDDGLVCGETFFLSHDGTYFYLGARLSDGHLDDVGVKNAWHSDSLRLELHEPGERNEWAGWAWVVFPTGCGGKQDEPCAGIWRDYAPGKGWKAFRTGETGRYVIEARLPIAAADRYDPGVVCEYRIMYQNVSGISRSEWTGIGSPAPKP